MDNLCLPCKGTGKNLGRPNRDCQVPDHQEAKAANGGVCASCHACRGDGKRYDSLAPLRKVFGG